MSWITSNGVKLEGRTVPYTVDTDKPLMVVGAGRCTWEDVLTYWDMNIKSDVMLINDAILHYPMKPGYLPIHAACYDVGRVNIYRELRKAKLNHKDIITHSVGEPADVVWKVKNVSSSLSGNFSAVIGLAMGYKRIVLCGCPEDNSGHYWDSLATHPKHDFGVKCIHFHWTDNEALFMGRVRSMSGWTREFFGYPTKEWLNGGE